MEKNRVKIIKENKWCALIVRLKMEKNQVNVISRGSKFRFDGSLQSTCRKKLKSLTIVSA